VSTESGVSAIISAPMSPMVADCQGADMSQEEKNQAEKDLLVVQKQKVLAEIDVLRRTTPLAESIKVFGSMVLGIGGAVAAVAGFQLAEVKAEKYKLEAAVAEKSRNAAAEEFKTLTVSRDKLKAEADELFQKVQTAKDEFAQLSDRLTNAQRDAATPRAAAVLKDIQQTVNAADINLRSVAPGSSTGSASLDSLIEGLFGQTAAIRGTAYEELLSRFAASDQLIPKLLSYSERHMDNGNGVYNALVLLSRLELRQLRSHADALRAFAGKAKAVGPRTAERAEKLVARLRSE
jgi:hypothetical protein